MRVLWMAAIAAGGCTEAEKTGPEDTGPIETTTTEVGLTNVADVACAGVPIGTAGGLAAVSLAADADHLYLGGVTVFPDVPPELDVVDVSDPSDPVRGTAMPVDFGDALSTMEASDGWLAAVTGDLTLVTVDLSDPSAPVLSGSRAQDHGAFTVGNGRIYVSSELELQVLDPSDPALPVLGSEDVLATGLTVAGDQLAVIDGLADEVVLYDVSDPDMLEWLGYVEVDARWLVAAGELVVAARLMGDIRIDLWILDPADGAILGELSIDLPGLASFVSLAASGDRVYVAGVLSQQDVLWAVDIADPSAPAVIGGWAPAGESTMFEVEVVDGRPWVLGILGDLPRVVGLDFEGCR